MPTAKGASVTTPFEMVSTRGGFSLVASSTTVKVVEHPAGSVTWAVALLLLIKSSFLPSDVPKDCAATWEELTVVLVKTSPGPKLSLRSLSIQ